MLEVLISIQPKWVEKIASGKKTIDVRKTRPKIETPFKCYIYETKGKQVEHCDGCDVTYYGRGKVIGEFICDNIDEMFTFCNGTGIEVITRLEIEQFIKNTCLCEHDICNYLGEQVGYGWHISNLKIYNIPKELSYFYKPCPRHIKNRCSICKYSNEQALDGVCLNYIKKAPQSWCYVQG